MEALDLHQHLWPETVLTLLEGRPSRPRARWSDGRWEIEPLAEPRFTVDPRDHGLDRRQAELDRAGIDRAIVALSSPVGLEELDRQEALAVVDAWHRAAGELPRRLGWWAFVPSRATGEEQRAVVHAAVARGAAGVCLPTQRLAHPESAHESLPVLTACAEAGVPALVHPGPPAGTVLDPSWWSPATDYVAQQARAWHVFHAGVRPRLPELRVVFALLAGLAPLGCERSIARGAPGLRDALGDPLCFYDVSSYAAPALRGMVCALGLGQLVYGSDHPVAAAPDVLTEAFGADLADIVRRDGAAGALGTRWVPA